MQKSHKIITHRYNDLSYYKTDLRRENLSLSTQLGQYLEQNNLLHPHQGAYHCGKSTEDILLLAVDHTATSLDKGSVVCAAFIDLRKAFDSLGHSLLLQRISELGVHSTVVEWFIDYLSNRCHRIKSSATFSSWRLMKGGIPQGSALGPLLLLIYMNSLPAQLANGLLLQYADNTTIICNGATPAAVQNTIKKFVMWFKASHRSTPIYTSSDICWWCCSTSD